MNNIPLRTKQEIILIVDDSSDNLRLLSTMLSSQGYTVKKAVSGKFALQALDVINPDLILLDINMPEMDGYQVCNLIKSKEKYRTTPIIFISASDQIFNKVKAFQVGGIDYITKPFQLEEVLIRIENQLNQKRLYQELQRQNELLENEIAERRRAENALTEANKKLELLAWLDGLTGIANRRKFDEYIHQEWERARREQIPLSLILVDVDFFKLYNDKLGHLMGDDCLKKVASILHYIVRKSTDLVARYGGEEFVLVLPNTPQEGAIILAGRIQYTIAAEKIIHPNSSVSDYLTLSMGINTKVPDTIMQVTDFINMADQALFKAKKAGRGRIEFYQESITEGVTLP